MSRWLDAFRAGRAAEVADLTSPKTENPEKGENLPRHGDASGETTGIRDFRGFRFSGAADARARAVWLAQAAADAFEALQAPDPDLAREREETARARADEARGAFGKALPEADHRAALAGFLDAARQRPPSWSDAASVPPSGACCSCCGKFTRRGGRWWREAEAPTGWRCSTCHPAPPGRAVTEVAT